MVLSKNVIKKFIEANYKIKVNDPALDMILNYLNEESIKIADGAVSNAKHDKRSMVIPLDIENAIIKSSIKNLDDKDGK